MELYYFFVFISKSESDDQTHDFQTRKSRIASQMVNTIPPVIVIQIPTRIPEKIVVALFSGIVVNFGIQVEAKSKAK